MTLRTRRSAVPNIWPSPFLVVLAIVFAAASGCSSAPAPSTPRTLSRSDTLEVLSPAEGTVTQLVASRHFELQGQGEAGRVVAVTAHAGAIAVALGAAPIDQSGAWRLTVQLPTSGQWGVFARYRDESWSTQGFRVVRVADPTHPEHEPWWISSSLGWQLDDLAAVLSTAGFSNAKTTNWAGERERWFDAWHESSGTEVSAIGDPVHAVWISYSTRCPEVCPTGAAALASFAGNGPDPIGALASAGFISPDSKDWIAQVLSENYRDDRVLDEPVIATDSRSGATLTWVAFPFPVLQIITNTPSAPAFADPTQVPTATPRLGLGRLEEVMTMLGQYDDPQYRHDFSAEVPCEAGPEAVCGRFLAEGAPQYSLIFRGDPIRSLEIHVPDGDTPWLSASGALFSTQIMGIIDNEWHQRIYEIVRPLLNAPERAGFTRTMVGPWGSVVIRRTESLVTITFIAS